MTDPTRSYIAQRVQVRNIEGLCFQIPCKAMVFGTRNLKSWLLGASGFESPGSCLHFSKLTWKCRGSPFKTTVLYERASMGFHVNVGEGACRGPRKGLRGTDLEYMIQVCVCVYYT